MFYWRSLYVAEMLCICLFKCVHLRVDSPVIEPEASWTCYPYFGVHSCDAAWLDFRTVCKTSDITRR